MSYDEGILILNVDGEALEEGYVKRVLRTK